MGIWNSIFSWLNADNEPTNIDGISSTIDCGCDINPATSLPMINDSGVDVGGSTFGTDIHEDSSMMGVSDDSWAEISSCHDNSWDSGNMWED